MDHNKILSGPGFKLYIYRFRFSIFRRIRQRVVKQILKNKNPSSFFFVIDCELLDGFSLE
jgi:hypothetical protein